MEGVCGREEQGRMLASLLGQEGSPMPCSLFLWGHSGTGKTLVARHVLRRLGIRISHVNCVEAFCPQVLYEAVLSQLRGSVPSATTDLPTPPTCDSLGEFVHHLDTVSRAGGQPRMAILLENCERLRDSAANIFPGLCRLQELTPGINITVIFMSTLPVEKFRISTGFMEPLVVFFPQYTKDELQEILQTLRPSTASQEFFKNYISLVLSVFYLATRDLAELMHQVQQHFEAYCEPVVRGEAEEEDVRPLWRNIEPHLKKALSTVYLREVSRTHFDKMQKLIETSVSEMLPSELRNINSLSSKTAIVELPLYSRYLLIAAHLASYNPARTDRRFFMKHHGKQRKTQASIKAKERCSSHLLGPKTFPLDRLMAIFHSIVEEDITPTASLFSQLATLLSLRLLIPSGGDDVLQNPKYKCVAPHDVVHSVCRTINFDLSRYTYSQA
ncbi:Origin recognition complex subunit 5 [Chionoecetes opilio]|uniref:Origin recognition complex subunit 5 n=1 Tax=Chionoecetes opilio TaxID=41210 RepID=A0A8J4XN16_CHIOP|nr:Origin recognition complex subunit 5 [Chionoecetes opilio]